MQTKYDENAYSALLERIYSITPSVQNVGFSGDAYKPGLTGMQAFDARLGHPWKQYRCIHVAGTNGKGSVASMIAAALAGSEGGCGAVSGGPAPGGGSTAGGPRGLRVGLYTSPHLVDFRERMKVVTASGWTMPSKEEVWDFFQSYLCSGSGELDFQGLSFFEMTTGLAFWWFARQGVDVAVIEAGLGGRLDSTNIITPELAVITSIGLDHCALLGSTRAAIAGEKAGIFKPGVSALVASEDPETAPVFREAAARVGAPLHFADSVAPEALAAVFSDGPALDETSILSRMDLRGPCQKQNLHTVLVALSLLGTIISSETYAEKGRLLNRSLFFEGDLNRTMPKTGQVPSSEGGPKQKNAKNWIGPLQVKPESASLGNFIATIERTAEITGLRGRWERLCSTPEVVCDIAHNPPALEINFGRLREIGRPLAIVYGIMADKDLAGIAPLMPEGARYILAAPAIPRALPAAELQKRLNELRPDLATETAPSVAAAVEKAVSEASPRTFIYIGGSTFVVTEAIEYFNREAVLK